MLVGCLLSSDPRPCEPCAQRPSGPGSRRLPFYAFRWHPSCGTCGGGKSPDRCGVGRTGMPGRRSSPGSWQWLLCHSFWGWPWKNSRGHCCLRHCLACHPGLQWPSWWQAQGTPFCGCAAPKRRQRLVSSIFHSRSWHCSARLLCGSGMTSHSPQHKHRRGRTRALLTCLASQLAAAAGMWWCEAL